MLVNQDESETGNLHPKVTIISILNLDIETYYQKSDLRIARALVTIHTYKLQMFEIETFLFCKLLSTVE